MTLARLRPDGRPRAVVTGAGSAYPESVAQDDLWERYFARHHEENRWARRVFMAAGVEHRHAVANPLVEDLSSWSTEPRMQRYAVDAIPLGTDAICRALDAAGVAPSEIGLFAVASCTGYSTPGVDIVLARDVGMAPTVERLLIGHMGCYAALPGLAAVSDFVVARQRPALLLCLELASLHVQPPTADLEQVVAHALFSDAASAVVVEPAGTPRPSASANAADAARLAGLAVIDVAAATDVATADHMTWDITDLGFRMGLSKRVPSVLAIQVGPLVDGLLARNSLSRADIDAWAVHPGGPQILDVVGERLCLPESALAASRHVLACHGNCSSATVLMVLDEIRRSRPLEAGSHVVLLAFGPGLTLYATLLQSI